MNEDYSPNTNPRAFYFRAGAGAQRLCTTVTVTGDDAFEEIIEDLFADLIFLPTMRIIIEPARTKINIIDDDSMLLYFCVYAKTTM